MKVLLVASYGAQALGHGNEQLRCAVAGGMLAGASPLPDIELQRMRISLV